MYVWVTESWWPCHEICELTNFVCALPHIAPVNTPPAHLLTNKTLQLWSPPLTLFFDLVWKKVKYLTTLRSSIVYEMPLAEVSNWLVTQAVDSEVVHVS